MRLDPDTLDRLPPNVARFAYDRDAQKVGIVHFGIGAFHRAHLAWYTDAAMSAGERDWMITGVSLRSDAVARQLNPQGGLYTLTERAAGEDVTRVAGAVRDVLVAGRSDARLAIGLIAPSTHIVSFTVTEKGYARAADGSLDLGLAEASFYPHLTRAFEERRQAGIPGLTLLSCDNLPANGDTLRRLMCEYLVAKSPDALGWFESECNCPNAMVDRIVPATTDADIDALASRIGLRDEGAVFTEPFSQWVIEDRFAGPRPGWDHYGAQFVADVAPYETAKLRMLNGAHSAMAYLGLERGHEFVHEAIADPELRALVERLMRDEAATSFEPAPGQDLDAYAKALLERFANPALNHRLAQIAMDGSQKIPQRWLASLAVHQTRSNKPIATLTALAAWLRHVRDGLFVDDPLKEELATTWRKQGVDGIVPALFGDNAPIASNWRPSPAEKAFLEAETAR
ncbi:mannitol dehydrogenase family protein [Altererythrobacter salegens]|uniref:Mannitol dehydrogenase family protein n=1 Tax=Croceibacterium salegens TaxID=1737568 RepID=A0A6I4T0J7_9SPHN|nr:mannitol dehydrogenase family protein [Croceibacterium salegens]